VRDIINRLVIYKQLIISLDSPHYIMQLLMIKLCTYLYGVQFLFLICNDTCHIFLQFLSECFFNKILPSFYSKYNLNINLGICICHFLFFVIYISLLTELISFLISLLLTFSSFGAIYFHRYKNTIINTTIPPKKYNA